jgi:hypothetical protein
MGVMDLHGFCRVQPLGWYLRKIRAGVVNPESFGRRTLIGVVFTAG